MLDLISNKLTIDVQFLPQQRANYDYYYRL